MICHLKDGNGILHDISIQTEQTVRDFKKSIEDVMIKFEYQKKKQNDDEKETTLSTEIEKNEDNKSDNTKGKPEQSNKNKKKNYEGVDEILALDKSDLNNTTLQNDKLSLSLFQYRRDLFTIKYKSYTLYNEQKLSELDIKEGDLFIIEPLQTVKIFFMLPINSKKYFDRIFKPQFLYEKPQTNPEEDNNNNNDDEYNDAFLKVNFKWNNKVGWLIGPISIPINASCAITLLIALEAVFGTKKTNIKIFNRTWNEIKMLSTIAPITKNNLVFGLYIRNQAEELKNFPNKNYIAWTSVFKYRYYNLPLRTKSRQLLHSKSNSKLQVLIAQPIPQEEPKKKTTKNDAIPLGRARSGPLKGSQSQSQSQVQLNKSTSIVISQNNDDYSIPNRNMHKLIEPNVESSHFYHPIPIFFSYDNDKKILACFDSDEIICTQMMGIKKDLGIPESTKIGIEFNGKIIDANLNPEKLKIIEFSTLKIVLPGSCLLI